MTKYKCALIEEDKMVASLVRFRLRKLQFDVHHLSNSNFQGLRTLGADIVLIGLHSNNLNTIGILSEIRAIIGIKTPMVAILSNKRQQLVIDNNNIQVEGYLSSPVSLSDLENIVVELINKKECVNKE
ncbi:hypothetical protein [Galbibacter sp.]|uniref:hypothetical protein n=1 Tax=Galbibacter sp. TaxID=2918471 RepID=UPI003A9006A9